MLHIHVNCNYYPFVPLIDSFPPNLIQFIRPKYSLRTKAT